MGLVGGPSLGLCFPPHALHTSCASHLLQLHCAGRYLARVSRDQPRRYAVPLRAAHESRPRLSFTCLIRCGWLTSHRSGCGGLRLGGSGASEVLCAWCGRFSSPSLPRISVVDSKCNCGRFRSRACSRPRPRYGCACASACGRAHLGALGVDTGQAGRVEAVPRAYSRTSHIA